MKALLFINGEPPKALPDYRDYGIIACTDGAFHYLKEMGFPLSKLDFVSGDFDSHSGADEPIYHEKFIHTPDQNKTDFDKALEILCNRGATSVAVFGASGGEMDHFLGNLTVAFRHKNHLNIRFFDNHSEYFFVENDTLLSGVNGRMISIYPFPSAKKVTTDGLNWELSSESLSMTNSLSTRNFAVKDSVRIQYLSGNILLFIGDKYL